jgi:hypothetical protein
MVRNLAKVHPAPVCNLDETLVPVVLRKKAPWSYRQKAFQPELMARAQMTAIVGFTHAANRPPPIHHLVRHNLKHISRFFHLYGVLSLCDGANRRMRGDLSTIDANNSCGGCNYCVSF